MALCRNHPGEEALYECAECRSPLCPLCLVMFGRKAYCRTCARTRHPGIPKLQAADLGIRTRPRASASEAFRFAGRFAAIPLALAVLIALGVTAARWRVASDPVTAVAGGPSAMVWIYEGGTQYGPYAGGTLRAMYRRGEVGDQTLVSVGGGEYRPLGEMLSALP